MEGKITKQERNPFLKREEIIFEIKAESVPSASEIISELKKDETLTVVKKINTAFGKKKFLAEILVYDSKEIRNEIEVIPKKVKKKIEADRKAAEAEAKKKAKAEAEAKAAAEAESQNKEGASE